MRLERLDHLYYWTEDMDRAIGFYRDVLGLQLVRREGESWAEFDAGSVRLALHGAAPGRPGRTRGATVVFEVDDLDAARAALRQRGVELLDQLGEVEGYARFASFLDPDGNTVQVIEYRKGAS